MQVVVGHVETPEEAAQSALRCGAHIVGVSSLAAGRKTLMPELIAALKNQDAEDMVICGGIISSQDYDFLYDAGVAAILADTPIPQAATQTLTKALSIFSACIIIA